MLKCMLFKYSNHLDEIGDAGARCGVEHRPSRDSQLSDSTVIRSETRVEILGHSDFLNHGVVSNFHTTNLSVMLYRRTNAYRRHREAFLAGRSAPGVAQSTIT